MRFTIFAFCMLVFSAMGSGVMARNVCEVDDGSFVRDVGDPVSVSFYQPLDGLKDEVLRLGGKGGVTFSPEWQPFYNSEVLVYFFLNDEDVKFLPNAVSVGLRLDVEPLETAVSIRTLAFEDGQKKMLILFKMEGFIGEDFDLLVKRLSHLVYWAIAKDPVKTDFERFFRTCND